MYKQVRKFDHLKGGRVKNWCLRNVRLGYSIGPRYNNAWEAWLNTDQHTGPIPKNVDTPVYFWYLNARNGHIGVHMSDGKFWSDGKIYNSLRTYRLTHPLVLYRGWSTSVNNVKVIEYVQPARPKMPPVKSKIRLTKGVSRTTFRAGTTRRAGTINATDNTFIYTVRGYDPRYPNRIIINSRSAGGNGVALALYYTNDRKIDGWTQI